MTRDAKTIIWAVVVSQALLVLFVGGLMDRLAGQVDGLLIDVAGGLGDGIAGKLDRLDADMREWTERIEARIERIEAGFPVVERRLDRIERVLVSRGREP